MGTRDIAVNNTDTILLKMGGMFKKWEVTNKGCPRNVQQEAPQGS